MFSPTAAMVSLRISVTLLVGSRSDSFSITANVFLILSSRPSTILALRRGKVQGVRDRRLGY
jgi:hypothetical protein